MISSTRPGKLATYGLVWPGRCADPHCDQGCTDSSWVLLGHQPGKLALLTWLCNTTINVNR